MKRLLPKLFLLAITSSLFSLPVFANVLSTYDDFNVDVTSGWGDTRTGNSWITQGSGTFSVDNSVGNVVLSSTYTSTHALTNIGYANVEGTAILHVDGATSAGYIDAGITLRHSYISSGELTAYRAFLRFENGATRLVVGKVVSDTITNFETFTLPITAQANENFVIKFAAYGTSPTILAAKVWPEHSIIPSDWQIITEDSETILQQTNGYTGVNIATSSTYSGSGSVSYEDFFVGKCGASCATNLENISNGGFDASILGSTSMSYYQGGTTTSSYSLSSISSGTPTHVLINFVCNMINSGNGNDTGTSKVTFLDTNNSPFFEYTGCELKGPGNHYSKTSEIIELPQNAGSFTLSGINSNGTADGSITLYILGNP